MDKRVWRKEIGKIVLLSILSSLVWVPLWMLWSGSFMGTGELIEKIGPVFSGSQGEVNWSLLPDYPTLQPYVELLLDSPGFFVMFWNSCHQVFPILLGQFLIAVPAAWAFARFNFPGKKILFSLYIVLMLMPFQVLMVSNYFVLDFFQLLNTSFAIIFPSVFSAFPVFIMVKFFSSIPRSLIEAAKIDGANEFQIFWKIGVPLGMPGILSAMILSFLEYWNAVEQPLTFLEEKSKWPLSLYLPNITTDNAGVSFAASVVMMIPALLLFLYGQKYLEEGIRASGMKE